MMKSAFTTIAFSALTVLTMACTNVGVLSVASGEEIGTEVPLDTPAPGTPVSGELEHDELLSLLSAQILQENPGMVLQGTVAKKMTLAKYIECIGRTCDGKSIHDLVSPERAEQALETDVWVVGFRSTDEIWRMSWYIRPPNVQEMENARANMYRDDNGVATSCLAIDSRSALVIAAKLAPSDWIAAECYDRLLVYVP